MAPFAEVFPPEEIPARAQIGFNGKRRKPAPGATATTTTTRGGIDLSTCEAFTLMQATCWLKEPVTESSPVVCRNVPRLYRK